MPRIPRPRPLLHRPFLFPSRIFRFATDPYVVCGTTPFRCVQLLAMCLHKRSLSHVFPTLPPSATHLPASPYPPSPLPHELGQTSSPPLRPRTIRVTFAASDTGRPAFFVEVIVEPRPFVVDRYLRLIHAEDDAVRARLALINMSAARKQGAECCECWAHGGEENTGMDGDGTFALPVDGKRFFTCSMVLLPEGKERRGPKRENNLPAVARRVGKRTLCGPTSPLTCPAWGCSGASYKSVRFCHTQHAFTAESALTQVSFPSSILPFPRPPSPPSPLHIPRFLGQPSSQPILFPPPTSPSL